MALNKTVSKVLGGRPWERQAVGAAGVTLDCGRPELSAALQILQETLQLLQQQHSKWISQLSIFLMKIAGSLEKTKPRVQS